MNDSADLGPGSTAHGVPTPLTKWGLRSIVVVVAALAGVALGLYGSWQYRLRGTAVDFANRYVDNILAGRLPQAVLLAIYPEMREGVTAEQAFFRQPRAVKGVRESPLFEFAFGKLESTAVTVVGLLSAEGRMQTNPTGVRMDSVMRTTVRYRLTRAEKTMTVDVILHGYGNSGFADYSWHVFDVADRPKL